MMINIQRLQVFRLCSLILLLGTGTPALAKELPKELSEGHLVVRISGFTNDAGKAMLALVNSVGQYKARKGEVRPYQSVTLPIKNGRASWRFEKIPYGEYAIKVFHDKNANGKLDTNFLGIPAESYGFSNNVRGVGPPGYEEAKFDVSTKQSEITIIVK